MKHNSGVRWYSTILNRNLWQKSLNLIFQIILRNQQVMFINWIELSIFILLDHLCRLLTVVQNSDEKENCMTPEVNVEVSKSHSNEASNSSTTSNYWMFSNAHSYWLTMPCNPMVYPQMSNVHMLIWHIHLWRIRLCIIQICQEVKGTLNMDMDIIMVNGDLIHC